MYEILEPRGICEKIGLLNKPAQRNATARSAYLQALESRTLLSAYFVNASTGSDANTGSASSPFQTIQRAANLVQPGDIVTIAPGTYAGFSLNNTQNGTAAAPITFNAQPGATINTRAVKTPDAINLEGASYITIEGFTIVNPDGSITRAGIRAVTDTNVTIQNNNVNGCGDWGIFTGFSENVTIQYNTASNSITQHGIYVSNSADNPIIRGNISFGNHDAGIQLNGDITEGGDGIISNAIIEDNIIYNNGIGGGSAINLDGVQNGIIENNLLYNNNASGISLFRNNGGGPSSGNLVENNTIIQSPTARWAINIENASINNTLYNNILDNQNPNKGAINISADSLPGLTSDYNLIINNRFSDNNGSSTTTLANWQSLTGQDTHSIISTEQLTFIDSSYNNYHLAPNSPAIAAGTTIDAPLTDLDGNSRPTGGGVDIGADQSNSQLPPAPTTNPTTTTLSSSLTSAPLGQPITFNVTVSSSGTIPTGTITFLDGTTAIDSESLDSSANASFTDFSLAAGTHNITALYSGDANSTASISANLCITIIAPDPPPVTTTATPVSFNGHFNTTGIYNDNSTFYKRAGLDGQGDSFSAQQLGTSITAANTTFTLRPGNMTNVLTTDAQTLKLPKGQFSTLAFLGASTSGIQSATFTIHYTDGSSQTFTQSFDDWSSTPASLTQNESLALSMSSYNLYNGQSISRTTNLYAYSIALDPTKTVASITLPKNSNIKLLAMNLIA